MENIENLISEFRECFCPYWYLDIQTAIRTADEVWISPQKLYEIAEDEADALWMKIQELDICYTIYEHILQEARTTIDNVCDFDLCNDADFNTYWNYMATSYDYSNGDLEKLQEIIDWIDTEQRERLNDDDFVKFFFDNVWISFTTLPTEDEKDDS